MSSYRRSRSRDRHYSSSSYNNNDQRVRGGGGGSGGGPVNGNGGLVAGGEQRDKYAGDYVSICLKNLNDTLSDSEIRESIYNEFKRFGSFNVKVVHDRNTRDHRHAERIAFVNFNSHRDASEAKRTKMNLPFHGYPLYIEPVFKNKAGADYRPVVVRQSRNRNRSRSQMSSDRSGSRGRRYSSSPTPMPQVTNKNRRYQRSPSPLPSVNKRISKRSRSMSQSLSPPPPPSLSQPQRHHQSHYGATKSRRHAMPSMSPSPPPQYATHKPNRRPVSVSSHSSRSGSPNGTSANNFKYRNHREHIDPAFDKIATRTIFVGALDPDVEKDEIRRTFERYGYIEEIDLKRVPHKKAYAFIRFVNLDMAYNAKCEMSGKILGRYEIKIGYARLQSTNCLWVGGLNSRAHRRDIEKTFGQYGKINEIDFNQGDQYAYISYERTSCAEDARNGAMGKYLDDGCSRRLRIDYADPERFKKRRDSSKSASRSASTSPAPPQRRQKPQRSYSRESNVSGTPPPVTGKRSNNYENGSDEKLSKKLKSGRQNKSKSPKRTGRRASSKSSSRQREQSKSRSRTRSQSSEPNGNRRSESTARVIVNEKLINKDIQLAQRIQNVNELTGQLKHTWNGVFTLKKIAFPTKFYLLAGNRQLAEQVLPTSSQANSPTQTSCLRITQRLRLDPNKIEELEDKLHDCNFSGDDSVDSTEFSLLIALPNENARDTNGDGMDAAAAAVTDTTGELVDEPQTNENVINVNTLQQRSLHNLIIYLNQKSAAGVIPLPNDERPTAMVHAFPPNCEFSLKLLKQIMPNIKCTTATTQDTTSNNNNYALNSDYLIIVLLKS